MKKMMMGIVAMMMAFGTMTANANSVVNNDKKGNNDKVTVVMNDKDGHKGHGMNGHNDRWNDNHRGNDFNHGHFGVAVHHNHRFVGDVRGRDIMVKNCNWRKVKNIGMHRHVYFNEVVRGRYTGHTVCGLCGLHVHMH